MSSAYTNYLHLKTTLQDLPKNFYNKLTENEKGVFDELLTAIDSILPSSKKKKSKTNQIVVGNFQPRTVIMCLNLKKISTGKMFSLKRFAFGLMRCLYKEVIRQKASQVPKGRRRKEEAKSKDFGTSTEDIEISILRVRAEGAENRKNTLKGVVKLMTMKQEKKGRNWLFSEWKRIYDDKIRKKSMFLGFINKVLVSRLSQCCKGIFAKKVFPRMTSKLMKMTLSNILMKRMGLYFHKLCSEQIVKVEAVRKDPGFFTVEAQDFMFGCNFKEAILSEINENVLDKENECAEEFRYGPRKNTKMIKKKKQLLRRSKDMDKITVLDKNHRWVLAFALLKWKKLYFSIHSDFQNKSSLAQTMSQLLEKIYQKVVLNRKSMFFQLIKVKYDINKQSRPFKISLGVSHLDSIISRYLNKYILYSFYDLKEFNIRAASPSSPSGGARSQSPGSNADLQERKAYCFYCKLKSVLKKAQLKKKIMAFVSLQNFYDTRVDRVMKNRISALFQMLQRSLFGIMYNAFQDIREKSVANMIKSQAFYFIVQSVIEKNLFVNCKKAFTSIKAYPYGSVNYLVRTIDKKLVYSHLRTGFDSILNHCVNLNSFLFVRAMIAKKVYEKTYFKRLSSSFLTWIGSTEDYQLAKELGLVDANLDGKFTTKFEFGTINHNYSSSQDQKCEKNYFLTGHSRFFSEYLDGPITASS
ncbi:hypothetical protein SteCoe_13545 [Stentor coeruleus]|uniref:Uncharacterized protein n=1 Tax=Stentor coeruleus TaxID=5963 RepID=A0A1R2C883_9CILI|nr:hypothetical protein SteCoe_13545 [Stentor coeruleus]